MKKLLFSLVAAAACGAVTAAPVEFTGLTTFDPAKPDDGGALSDQNRTYWEINTGTDPELAVSEMVAEQNVALGYLKINTGSTPLWRTFSGVDNPVSATNETLDAAAVDADGKVVSSDVKLTACTEWPTLTDFANEKLALFLFAPEEGDTSNMPAGLYAVGGAMVTPEGESTAVLTNKAYKLTVAGNDAITNAQGWATIKIKTYGDIYKTSGNKKLAGFVIAVGDTIATRSDATGFSEDDLAPAAATRNNNGTLIPAAIATATATITGLGFQGEGGIDNVDLAAAEFAADATTMTATVSQDVTVTAVTGASAKLVGNKLEFTESDPQEQVTIKFTSTADIVKVNGERVTADEDVYTYTFTPVKDGSLEITTEAALFQANGTGYGTFAEALAAALAEGADGTVTLLADLPLGTTVLSLTSGNVTIDLNGQTISGSGNETDGATVIMNSGATLVITDSSASQLGNITANNGAYAIWNAAGTLTVNKGIFNGAIFTDDAENGADGTATINGGKFTVKVEAATILGDKKWSDLTDGYYTLVDAGPVTSTTVDLSEAGTGADVEVTPTIAESVTEVTVENVPQGFAGKVVIPSTVDKIIGVAKDQLKVMVSVTGDDSVTKTYNITEAIKLAADGTISLDDTKKVSVEVTVGETTVTEEISVKPELAVTAADGKTEVAPFEAGATPAATVKTIPGLTYSLDFDSDVKGTFGISAAAKTADGNRMTLQDTTDKTGVTKRFYKIRVSK